MFLLICRHSIRYTSKGGQIFPPSKHEPIHNQQLNKNGGAKAKQGGKTGRANMMWGGGKTGREDREGGQKQKKMEGRTEAEYGIMKRRRTTGSGILLRNF